MRFATFTVLLVFIFCLAIYAGPDRFNYQGRLTDAGGNPVADGSNSLTFRIYDAPTGGTVLWSETRSVTTEQGVFSVTLGETNPIPSELFSGSSRYLGVQVGSDPELVPRTLMASVPFAHSADFSDSAFESRFADTLRTPGAASGDILTFDGATWVPESPATAAPLPGIAATHTFLSTDLVCDSMTDIVTVTITIPDSGYIHVQGSATVRFWESTDAITGFFQIDETSGGMETNPYYVQVGLSGYINAALGDHFPVYVDRIYQKDAGTYTFRLEGRSCSFDANADTDVYLQKITAMYFPVAYGAVSK